MSENPEIKRPTVHHVPITCESPTEKRQSATMHTPVPAPPVDDMEPQNISFIGKYKYLFSKFAKFKDAIKFEKIEILIFLSI